MADNVHYSEKLGRYAAFYADVPAWHNKGIVEQGLQQWKHVAEVTDLDHEVEVRQLEWKGNLIDAWGVFRKDNDAFYGTCGENYGIIQPQLAFEFIDTVLGNMDGARYEAAGQLGNGSRFWMLAKIPQDFKIGDDTHKTYLSVVSSHDGSFAMTPHVGDIREVCQNTIQIGLREASKIVRIKHTRNARDRMVQAMRVLRGTVETVETLHDRLDFLANHRVTKEGFEQIVNRLWPVKEDAKFQTKRKNVLMEILQLYENNDGNAFPEFKGTAYNLFNAIVEHTDHFRAAKVTKRREGYDTASARAESALFGSGADLKNNALDVVYEVAQNLPSVPYKSLSQRAIGSGDYSAPPKDNGGLLDSVIDNSLN